MTLSSSAADGSAASPAALQPPEPTSGLLHQLGPEDLEACLALDAASLSGLWTAEQWRRELQEPQRPGVGLRSGSALLAMACGWLVLEELHITLVAVDPAHRRRGFGLAVLQELLRLGRDRGAERATLEVSATNPAAQALYGRCNFVTAGVRRRYYRDGSDALIQWRRLDAR